MLTEIAGIPAHPLFVHGAVVLPPIAALLLVAAAWWPAARARLGAGTPVLALVATVGLFLATQSGERLAQRPSMARMQDRISEHETQGDATLYWSLAVLVLAVLVWAGSNAAVRERIPGVEVLSRRSAAITLGVLATLSAAAVIAGVIAAGHSGATMVWSGI
ncbi:DUF2231 domain-containing protein [Tsukamurella paurometabola]|uniref:DUF2231 domain-containing protein n=1 Tax=Tsukamurella paurometabola (strain ATCC 8368 / DSM 20162 / CCUG 35730 / CIP 100753 / JCM 10117 / KCTC 9821 / NBRC 16120 / NCIMB 702349 / NCTC 13040) TaxID=521096 RepID=D5UPR1_TSUPD|nr:DUF2231 domain-containing protein [Tsukamurella paurometabola]ADG78817.1 conserved hypothetical protein [Tsukamurella paurometabola DSM 20162]SUP33231.1 Uncharacterised protein [Tsukamurella paurometabola]